MSSSPDTPDRPFRFDLQRARDAVIEAELAPQPGPRYLAAHAAALQVAAVLLAWRRPRSADAGRAVTSGSGGPRNPWPLLAEIAPEFAEWALFFHSAEGKRDAVRAGATAIVTPRESDDLVRDAQRFLALVERTLEAAEPGPGSGGGTD